jgi:uncharacterized protein (DUF1778 family)
MPIDIVENRSKGGFMSLPKRSINSHESAFQSAAKNETILAASELLGQKPEEFIFRSSMEKAMQVLGSKENIALDELAWNKFCELLSAPKTPSDSLKAAVRAYKTNQGI